MSARITRASANQAANRPAARPVPQVKRKTRPATAQPLLTTSPEIAQLKALLARVIGDKTDLWRQIEQQLEQELEEDVFSQHQQSVSRQSAGLLSSTRIAEDEESKDRILAEMLEENKRLAAQLSESNAKVIKYEKEVEKMQSELQVKDEEVEEHKIALSMLRGKSEPREEAGRGNLSSPNTPNPRDSPAQVLSPQTPSIIRSTSTLVSPPVFYLPPRNRATQKNTTTSQLVQDIEDVVPAPAEACPDFDQADPQSPILLTSPSMSSTPANESLSRSTSPEFDQPTTPANADNLHDFDQADHQSPMPLTSPPMSSTSAIEPLSRSTSPESDQPKITDSPLSQKSSSTLQTTPERTGTDTDLPSVPLAQATTSTPKQAETQAAERKSVRCAKPKPVKRPQRQKQAKEPAYVEEKPQKPLDLFRKPKNIPLHKCLPDSEAPLPLGQPIWRFSGVPLCPGFRASTLMKAFNAPTLRAGCPQPFSQTNIKASTDANPLYTKIERQASIAMSPEVWNVILEEHQELIVPKRANTAADTDKQKQLSSMKSVIETIITLSHVTSNGIDVEVMQANSLVPLPVAMAVGRLHAADYTIGELKDDKDPEYFSSLFQLDHQQASQQDLSTPVSLDCNMINLRELIAPSTAALASLGQSIEQSNERNSLTTFIVALGECLPLFASSDHKLEMSKDADVLMKVAKRMDELAQVSLSESACGGIVTHIALVLKYLEKAVQQADGPGARGCSLSGKRA